MSPTKHELVIQRQEANVRAANLESQLAEAVALLQDYVRVYPNNSGRTTKFLDRISLSKEDE